MKKVRSTILIFALTVTVAFSQTAPDFTVTDINGETHQLYADYLDQGKTVVLDFFFVDCPPCQAIAPYFETLYQDWGAGQADVEFMSITGDPNGTDNDAYVTQFKNTYGLTSPAVSNQGNGPPTVQMYTNGTFGSFFGYPTFAVVAPDGTVEWDPWVDAGQATIDLIDAAIQATGATGQITDIDDVEDLFEGLTVYPNPSNDVATVDFNLIEKADIKIQVLNMLGQNALNVFEGNKYAGSHQIEMNVANLQPGTYLIRVTANETIRTIRFAKSVR